MPNKTELQNLQSIIAQLENTDYITCIEVSPGLYAYFQNQLYNLFSKKDAIQTFYGCPVAINMALEGFEYKIVRKEKKYE